jgi:hypothetical protein
MEIATFLAHQFLQENLYPHPISTRIVPISPPEASAFCGSWGTGCSTAFAENRRSSRFQTSSWSPKREGWVIDGSVFSDKQIFLHFFTIIYIYIIIYIYAYVYVYENVYVYVHVIICIFICIFICICKCAHKCIHNVCIYVFIFMYAHMCLHNVHIHINVHKGL